MDQTKLPQKIQASVQRANDDFSLRKEQFESRIARNTTEQVSLIKELEFERDFHDALVSSIKTPSVRIDSAGGIFLSNENPFAGERPMEEDE